MPLDFSDLIPAAPKLVGKRAGKAQPNVFDQVDDWQPVGRTGMFDDIPAAASPQQSGGLSFDDLIPQNQSRGDITKLSDAELMSRLKQAGTNRLASMSDEDLLAALGRTNDWEPANQGVTGTLGDVAKSAGIGLARGAIGLAGLPADLANLGAQGIDYLRGSNLQRYTQPVANVAGGQALQKDVEGYTGPFYQPKTTAGQYAQTIGEFAPAAIGGPETLAPRLATRVVAPAVASEAAGQAAEGTAFEPVARIAGALGGTLAAGKLAGTLASKLRPAAPTEQELETAATGLGQGYNDPAIKNLQLNATAGQDLANLIRADLRAAKVDKFNGGAYYDIANRLESPRFGPTLGIDDLEAARQDAVVPPATATPADKRGGQVIKNVIDNYLNGGIPQSHVLAGDADAANAALIDARGNFAAMKRSQDITNAMGRAENQAGSTYSGGNLENATRQQLKPILNQKTGVAKSQGFQDYTDQEIQALRNAVNGSMTGNLVRTIGGLAGRGHGLGALGAGVATAEGARASGADPMEAIAAGVLAAVGGRAMGALGNRLEANRANAVGQMLRSRSPLAQSRGIPVGGFPNVRALPPSQMLLQSALAPQFPYLPKPYGANQ